MPGTFCFLERACRDMPIQPACVQEFKERFPIMLRISGLTTRHGGCVLALLMMTGCAGQKVTHSGFLPEETYGEMTPQKVMSMTIFM
ncbi:hypothetical protein [Acetobacter papayae]|uniref:hypothetical protein n=1 Tax=Acetobacter papayae TaxID=1076592 RepID=UPI000A899856|nr:hypothetical protein [Acetobacter papayae]